MKKRYLELKKSIFKENDIRGKYPQEINEKTSFILGETFALILKRIYKKPIKIIIGYDNRKSSPTLANFLILGIKKAAFKNSSIISINYSTIPLFYFSMRKTKADAGIMITASHNPFSENGFLFYLKDGASFFSGKKWDKKFRETAYKILEKENKKNFALERRLKIKFLNFKEEYLNYLKKFVLIKKSLSIVLDDGGGSAGLVIKDFIKKLKNKNLKFFLIKGRKYRFSDPFILNKIDALKKEIIKRKADIGAAFDSDADRIIFLNEKGQIINSGKIFGFLIKHFLIQNKNAKFITTEFLNQKIREKIKKLGVKLIYSSAGYGNFYLKMKKNKAFFGSEHTGHYYFKNFNYHDDALLTLIFVLNFLSIENTSSFSQAIEEFSLNPCFWMNFKSSPSKSFLIIKILKEIGKKYQKPTSENLKLETKKWLMIWRVSGTSNLLRVYWEELGN